MCGIVSFFGPADGLTRVLEALQLLEYRAPDSAGVAVLTTPDGRLSVRRAVGPTRQLIATLSRQPLYATPPISRSISDLLRKQGLTLALADLRDCSPAAGYTVDSLYASPSLSIGIGDRGAPGVVSASTTPGHFSKQFFQAVDAGGGLASPDFDLDPTRHAFRLLSAHVANRYSLDPGWRTALNSALLARVPAGTYSGWQEAWEEEMALNLPGQAFAVAVRQFQQTFPGLSASLSPADWERFGGTTAAAMAQIVVGHGRWAMVGAVTEANAHPLLDRSQTRAVVENGSHNASLMLAFRADQQRWWQARGAPAETARHRSENTTEVIAWEWERAAIQLANSELSQAEAGFVKKLVDWGVVNPEEQALRLAMERLHAGNTHACACYSRREPGALYVTSHRKPIAIAIRTIARDGNLPRQEVMVASDVNAALMLWPGAEIEQAAARIDALQQVEQKTPAQQQELEALLNRFIVDVIFLDAHLNQGERLFARIVNRVKNGQVIPEVQVSRYDGAPVDVAPQPVQLNPVIRNRGEFATYTERHIAEIPAILDDLTRVYIKNGQPRLDSDNGAQPGLKPDTLRRRFGDSLQRLTRLLLVGEGSSWRDAQTAAPLFRKLLPHTRVNIYRPVELLNVGLTIYPRSDLAIEISWSGSTDSLLKVDDLLAELDVLRLAVTGRPQSDLGRRAANSAGTIDVRSGVEVSVATVKGFAAILATLNLLAAQLAHIRGSASPSNLARLLDELEHTIPGLVRQVIQDETRRARLRRVAQRCRHFNKVAVVGDSPIDIEGELKIEELAQIVATTLDFHSASLRGLMEASALADDDRRRTLFVINATSPEQQRQARPVINYLRALGVFCIIHTTPNEQVEQWQAIPTAEVFLSPGASPLLQPLIDAIFYFDLAVALAYARGLSPEEIDRPRNLAKSVTTTAAEHRREVEARQEFCNVSLAEFGRPQAAASDWEASRRRPNRAALRETVSLRAALVMLSEPLPNLLDLAPRPHLVVLTDTEATEYGAQMAEAAWLQLLGMDMTVYRRFLNELPTPTPDTALLRLVRAGATLAALDPHTVALPSDLTPLQLELLTAIYLMGLATRLARQQGADVGVWEAGLARLPRLLSRLLSDATRARAIRVALTPLVQAGYDKVQIIGGGQDHAAARSIARSLRTRGFMAESLYTDSAWHGPLATVGGPDADHDTLIIILATDPLFQPAALVDVQVYRTRNAPVILVVPEGTALYPAVQGVEPQAVLPVPAVPRPFTALVSAVLGDLLAREMAQLWTENLEELWNSLP